MSTFSLKKGDLAPQWFVVDAQNMVVGRLAAELVTILRGKHKPTYTPHMDCGDNIVVINADQVKFTGSKYRDQKYFWHTGYPGGIKERSAKDIFTGQYPDRVLRKAVERMLPRGVLGRQQLKNLRIYNGDKHPHAGQNPEILDLASRNPKNKR